MSNLAKYTRKAILVEVLGEDKAREVIEKASKYTTLPKMDKFSQPFTLLPTEYLIECLVHWNEHGEKYYWENLDKEYRQKLADYLKQNK